jgi:hypothetical protein
MEYYNHNRIVYTTYASLVLTNDIEINKIYKTYDNLRFEPIHRGTHYPRMMRTELLVLNEF